MSRLSGLSPSEQVSTHIQKLNPELSRTVQAVREIILETDPQIAEHIKWNSPAFFYAGDMMPFDPKEYKRDIVVMNLHRGHILLVFPTGSVITHDGSLLEGSYADGRRIAKILSHEDALSKAGALQEVLRSWLRQVEK